MNVLKGVALMFAFTLLFSVLSALLFRFPIPMAGMIGPFGELQSLSLLEALKGSSLAWAFYTAMAGGLPQVIAGLVLGWLARRGGADAASVRTRLLLGSASISLLMVLGLATLDWFIGPW